MDIIVDLDGTLTDCRHRLHYLEGKKEWQRFFDSMYDDPPNAAVLAIVRTFYDASHKIIFCSGRPDSHRSLTNRWLIKYDLPINHVYMRKAGDFRQDDIVKFELLTEIWEDGHDPDFVIDDRPSVITMWRRQGLPVLQYLQPNNSLNNDAAG